MSTRRVHLLVTGEHEEWLSEAPTLIPGTNQELRWEPLEVLRFERLPLAPELLERIETAPFDWIVFASRRAVRFFAETLVLHATTFPVETQVACIGERTAEAAGEDGFTPDFFPVEPGTEGFLREFEQLLSNRSDRPTVFLPAAEGGRTAVAQRLRDLGCTVTLAPLYRSAPAPDIADRLSKTVWHAVDGVVFTSPSSVDAILAVTTIPEGVRLFAIGTFTEARLKAVGLPVAGLLREGHVEALQVFAGEAR